MAYNAEIPKKRDEFSKKKKAPLDGSKKTMVNLKGEGSKDGPK